MTRRRYRTARRGGTRKPRPALDLGAAGYFSANGPDRLRVADTTQVGAGHRHSWHTTVTLPSDDPIGTVRPYLVGQDWSVTP